MGVVSVKSTLFPDRAAGDPPLDPEVGRGRPIVITGSVANASTDSANSLYHLFDLPAEALLDSRTAFDVTNWGFATVEIGTKSNPTALVNQLKSAGNTINPVAFADANHGKKVYEILGLAAPPENGICEIWASGPANAVAAGSMKFEGHYRWR